MAAITISIEYRVHLRATGERLSSREFQTASNDLQHAEREAKKWAREQGFDHSTHRLSQGSMFMDNGEM